MNYRNRHIFFFFLFDSFWIHLCLVVTAVSLALILIQDMFDHG